MDPFSLPAPSLYDIVTSLPLSWRYLSEGAANIVFAYVGPAGPLTSTVLRASKRAPGGAAAAALLATPPSPLAPFFPSPSYLPRSARVARPPRLAAHPAPWLLALRAEVAGAPARPACRLGGDALPADCALQLMDDAAAGAPAALCVELKPKCGLPPGGRGAPCRFCATQLVKCARPQRLSRFCPLELFSGDPPRVEGALRRLVGTPQNNLRVFCGGARVWGGEDGGGGTPADFGIALLRAGWTPRRCAPAGIGAAAGGAAAGGAAAAAAAPAADAAERAAADFLAAVAAALCEPHSPLPALRGVQALGALAGNSAGGARDALAALGGGGGGDARDWGGVCRALQRACAAGAPPPPPAAGGGEGSAFAVAGFLLAATAMDASVMMAVRPAGGGGGGGAREWYAVPGAGVEVAWAVVDAELKSAEKLDSWVAAEAARREAWERGGAQRFAEEGKVCAALAHAEEEPAEGLCPE